MRDRPRVAEVRPGSGSELAVHCHGLLLGIVGAPSIALWQPRDQQRGAALRRAAQAQGYAGDLVRQHGGSDGGYYSAHGIPAVACGIGGGGQHGPEEYAEIATIEPYYRALTDFVRRL